MDQFKRYHSVLSEFPTSHPLHMDRGQEVFDQDLQQWHTDLLSFQVIHITCSSFSPERFTVYELLKKLTFETELIVSKSAPLQYSSRKRL